MSAQLDSGAAYLRQLATLEATSKWMAAAFGVIAGAVVGGLSLNGLPDASAVRIVITVIGVSCAVTSVGLVVFTTARVLVAAVIPTFEELEDEVSGSSKSWQEGGESGEISQIVTSGPTGELAKALDAQHGLYRGLPDGIRQPNDLRAHLTQLRSASAAPDELLAAHAAADRIVAFAAKHKAANAFRQLKWAVGISGVLLVSSAGLIAAATAQSTTAPADGNVEIILPSTLDAGQIEQIAELVRSLEE